ncbi:hypothetical protein B0A55_07450 [Friedmanniomyces simplex]|uniref:Uncharacterized protein n=1 Tax=Friedmanniomyces simplex TaxID=329884 RepID=A0A4U0X158_9PEZI|nr:hypothetical protein B0A55_07450 [Friedmanniomyces simplex]
MQRPRKPAPAKPLTNGYHKGDGTQANMGSSGSGGTSRGGSGGGSGTAAPSRPTPWFCCNMNCQEQVTWNNTAAKKRSGNSTGICVRAMWLMPLYEHDDDDEGTTTTMGLLEDGAESPA